VEVANSKEANLCPPPPCHSDAEENPSLPKHELKTKHNPQKHTKRRFLHRMLLRWVLPNTQKA